MTTTSHCRARMSKRGITSQLMDIVVKYGESCGDKYVLNKKSIKEILLSIDQFKKLLLKVQDKGGVVVVVENDQCITTYNADSFNKY